MYISIYLYIYISIYKLSISSKMTFDRGRKGWAWTARLAVVRRKNSFETPTPRNAARAITCSNERSDQSSGSLSGRVWHMQDSQGQILAVTLSERPVVV